MLYSCLCTICSSISQLKSVKEEMGLSPIYNSWTISRWCGNETKCDDSVNDSELVLPGYNLLRRDRSRNTFLNYGINY